MIVDYCDYNFDNKIFCRYKNRDISRFASSLEELQTYCETHKLPIKVYEGLDLDSGIMNTLDVKELREYNCKGTGYMLLSRIEVLDNPF